MNLKNLINDKKAFIEARKDILKEAEEKITQSFENFFIDYQNNNIDFQNLSNSQAIILDATPLGIKLLLEEGQSFDVKKVTTSKVYIMYFYKNSNFKKRSSKKDFIYSWSELDEINPDIKNMDVAKAVFNLSKDTGISVFTKNEACTNKLLKPLVKRLTLKLKEFVNNLNDDFDCEEIEILLQNKNRKLS